jgi:hypothetical protein
MSSVYGTAFDELSDDESGLNKNKNRSYYNVFQKLPFRRSRRPFRMKLSLMKKVVADFTVHLPVDFPLVSLIQWDQSTVGTSY